MRKGMLLVLLLVLVFSCTKEEFQTISPSKYLQFSLKNSGEFKVMPPDSISYQQLNIDLFQVRVKLDSGGWQDLPTNQGIYDLVGLQNTDTLVSSTLMIADSLKEVRLVLGPNNSIMVDSVIHELQVPRGSSSGLKFKFDPSYALTSSDTLSINFNGDASVNQTGNGSYKLHPVFHIE